MVDTTDVEDMLGGGWNFRAIKHPGNDEEVFIHEVYYDEDGDVAFWTVDPILIVDGSNPFEAVEAIKIFAERMKDAVHKPWIPSEDLDAIEDI